MKSGQKEAEAQMKEMRKQERLQKKEREEAQRKKENLNKRELLQQQLKRERVELQSEWVELQEAKNEQHNHASTSADTSTDIPMAVETQGEAEIVLPVSKRFIDKGTFSSDLYVAKIIKTAVALYR